jgi:dolichol-phosphate mannosyltransferase
MLSIIVPTYNERDNVRSLIPAVAGVLTREGIEGEILIVDDDSPDGTAESARDLAAEHPVRVVARRSERGLSGAVIRGIAESRGEILAVMDADHSHSPESLAAMYAAIRNGAKLVVGSRHVAGGGMADWPLHRRIVSRAAAWLALGLTSVRDPTSGFLMFRREILEGVELTPRGFKIGLELMVKGRHGGAVVEVPILFTDRLHGQSKLSGQVATQYLRHLWELYRFRLTVGRRH